MSGSPASYSTTVPAGRYQFKVTEGNWSDSYGAENVDAQNSTPGYEGTDNVIFTVASQANISVTFNGTSIVLTSNVPFVVPTVSDIEITGDLLVGNELTFSATVSGFSDDPEIIYSVEAPGSYYSPLSGNTYTPINPGRYKVKADATTYSQSAEKEVTFTVTVPRIEGEDIKDTVDVVVPAATFSIDKLNNRFVFKGVNSDSTISATIGINTSNFQAGTYPDSMVFDGSMITLVGTRPTRIEYSNGLGDVTVTITPGDSTTYYNLVFDFVGRDSVLYKLDMTYTVPYESTYHETTIAPIALDSAYIKYGMIFSKFEDSQYRYKLQFRATAMNESPIMIGDSVNFYVYDIADTLMKNMLYKEYSGSFTLTRQDTLYNLTGEILCKGNKKFYINCKKPTAVEDVVVAAYQVYTNGNDVIINGADGEYAAIYDITGRMVAGARLTSDNARFSMADGVYFVRINGQTTKVLVK